MERGEKRELIKHVYLFKLLEGVDPHIVVKKLLTLQIHIPQIQSMEVGINCKPAPNAYDIIECCTFRNKEDFTAFSENEYHEQIRQYMKTVQADGVKIDYEV